MKKYTTSIVTIIVFILLIDIIINDKIYLVFIVPPLILSTLTFISLKIFTKKEKFYLQKSMLISLWVFFITLLIWGIFFWWLTMTSM